MTGHAYSRRCWCGNCRTEGTLRLANVMVGCACIAFFGCMLAAVAQLGRLGQMFGWWGAGPVEVAVAVAVALAATITAAVGARRMSD